MSPPRRTLPPRSESDVLADFSQPLMWRTRDDPCDGAVNRSWRAFIGRQTDFSGHWLAEIHPEDRDPFLKRLAAAAERRGDFSASFRLRRHDGAFRRMMSSGRALVAKNGRFHGFLGFCTDITDQDDAVSGHLTADPIHAALLDEVRHRVRNTMQVIIGFVNLLNREAARGTCNDLGAMAERIQALALMQQYFYQSSNGVGRIELEPFLRAFAAEFAREAKIAAAVEVSGPGERVDIGRATGVGLLIAEAMLGGNDRCEGMASIHVDVGRTRDSLRIDIARAPGFTIDPNLLKLYGRLMSATPEVLREGPERIALSMSV